MKIPVEREIQRRKKSEVKGSIVFWLLGILLVSDIHILAPLIFMYPYINVYVYAKEFDVYIYIYV